MRIPMLRKHTNFFILCWITSYFCMVNINLTRRARILGVERARVLSIDLDGGDCKFTSPGYNVAEEDSKKTLLVSYPGSGKRFVYQLIEGLTDHAVGDDHGFSPFRQDTLHVKTSYPHNEGVWSWKDKMDQVILLLRNPRWALQSYHTLRFELDFSTSWAESYVRIPFVYTTRASVEDWEVWRDENFETEMQAWVDHIDYWMSGGINDYNCETFKLDCFPKTVLDFDVLYQEHTTSEFDKLGAILDATENVDVIGKQARACILESIFDSSLNPTKGQYEVTHNHNRNANGPPASEKRFTSEQLRVMYNGVHALSETYGSAPWDQNAVAQELVYALKQYARQITYEFEAEADLEHQRNYGSPAFTGDNNPLEVDGSSKDDGLFHEDIPDMSDEEIKKVIDWIAAETIMVKLPVCWMDSYGRKARGLPGRVADCPSSYTNIGLICSRDSDTIFAPSKVAKCPSGYTNMGYTCFRGTNDIHAPSKVARCPSGYKNMGLTCFNLKKFKSLGWKHFSCSSGYSLSDITKRCIKKCPSGYTNTGEFCHRPPDTKGMNSMTCPSGYSQSKITARCIKNCPNGYEKTELGCHRIVSILKDEKMTCKPDEYKKAGRCFPNGDNLCFNDGDFDLGLCYPRCKNGYNGIGPLCMQECDNSMVECGLMCTKTTADCIAAASDQLISTGILASNIASWGTAAPANAAADASTNTIQIGGQAVVGTTRTGNALVSAVNQLQAIASRSADVVMEGVEVVRTVYDKYDKAILVTKIVVKSSALTIESMNEYRNSFAEEFAMQTSKDIENELDSHFNPIAAKFIKGLWGEMMVTELAEANDWQIASTALRAAAIVDISGVSGVIAAFTKPMCFLSYIGKFQNLPNLDPKMEDAKTIFIIE